MPGQIALVGGDEFRIGCEELERSHAEDPDFFALATTADVVYFTGGSPEHLLETVVDSPFLKAVLDSVAAGSILAGSSAGAMAMGSMMRRPRAGGWVESLGVVPGVAVLPHHERRDQAETSKELQDTAPSGLTFLGRYSTPETCCPQGFSRSRLALSGPVS